MTPHNAPDPLTLDEALRLSSALSSSFQQARLNEQIAAEDVRQAQVAFLPRVTAPLSYLYTSPALGMPPGTPRTPSFIANNAIGEYQAYMNLAGDFDIAGRLRATLAKNRALLEAAHAGTEVARRALAQAVIEAYYGLALATAQRGAAEQNLLAAEEFERITSLLLSGGEVASVDLTRAQLQTLGRRDELERARANEAVAAGSLRVLVGYEFTQPISTTDLATAVPVDPEFLRYKVDGISRRPEFAQFGAQLRAAQQEVKIARADRLPQLSYSILGGFDTDSLRPPRLKEHTGVSGAISLAIPIFDWGASKSRERQAQLREQIAENERTIALRVYSGVLRRAGPGDFRSDAHKAGGDWCHPGAKQSRRFNSPLSGGRGSNNRSDRRAYHAGCAEVCPLPGNLRLPNGARAPPTGGRTMTRVESDKLQFVVTIESIHRATN